jgi:two-component system OmpR family response regulator
MRILLVEDDRMIGEALQGSLRDSAHAVDWVPDAEAAWSALRLQAYDVVLLDLGLPGQDGLLLLRRIRAGGRSEPVIVVTARDALESRVDGLDAGADDYLVKPFEMPELQARMRAVVRRKGGTITPVLENGLVWLDPANHTAGRQGAEGERLSNREFALLHALLSRPGAILSKAQLEEQIYGWGEEVESNVVDVLIHALRRKLGTDAILNVRGVGWRVSKPQ